MNGKFIKDLPIANILVPNGYTPTDPLDIATKAWVESLFSNTKFNNGLTVTSGVVQLGGNLIKNTFIDGNFNLRIGEATQLSILSLRASSLRFNNMIWPSADGTSGQVLSTNGSNTLSWITPSSGGTPAGANTQVQYNNNGSFGATSRFTYSKVGISDILSLGVNSVDNSAVLNLIGGSNSQLPTISLQRGTTNILTLRGGISIDGGNLYNGLRNYINSENGLAFESLVTIDGDAGGQTKPLVVIRAARSTNGTPTSLVGVRPIFSGYNYTTKLWEVAVNGNWNYQDNELTNIGGISVGVSFPTTNQPVGTLWNDAGTIKMGTIV